MGGCCRRTAAFWRCGRRSNVSGGGGRSPCESPGRASAGRSVPCRLAEDRVAPDGAGCALARKTASLRTPPRRGNRRADGDINVIPQVPRAPPSFSQVTLTRCLLGLQCSTRECVIAIPAAAGAAKVTWQTQADLGRPWRVRSVLRSSLNRTEPSVALSGHSQERARRETGRYCLGCRPNTQRFGREA